jgi:hypothetical protein
VPLHPPSRRRTGRPRRPGGRKGRHRGCHVAGAAGARKCSEPRPRASGLTPQPAEC